MISILTHSKGQDCHSFYELSKKNTMEFLAYPEATFYDMHVVATSRENPYAPSSENLVFENISLFAISRHRQNPMAGGLPTTIPNQNILNGMGFDPRVPTTLLERQNVETLEKIYDNYFKQGPERKDNIPLYKAEDEIAKHRTTQFLLYEGNQAVGRSQLQHSLKHSDKLNVETHFDVEELIRNNEDVFFELGRLFIPNPKIDGFGIKEYWKRTLAFYELFLRPCMYVAGISKNAVLTIQVNRDVLKKLNERISPYRLRNIKKVSRPQDPDEFLITIRGSEVNAFAKILFFKRLQIILEKFSESGLNEIRIAIHPDEKHYYDIVGAHNLSVSFLKESYRKIWYQTFSSTFGLIDSSKIQIKATFSLDDSSFLNPHFLVLAKNEVNILLQRLQNQFSKFSE